MPFNIPDSSPDWLPVNPGHGTKILAALVAGNPLTLVTHVLLTGVTSCCVLLMADR